MSYLEEALVYAKSVYPEEACGVTIFENNLEVFVPCKNIAQNPLEAFAIDPIDYANAEDRGEILKIFHSHPNSPPEPSQIDKIGMESSNLPWVIINPLTEKYRILRPSGYKAPLLGRQFHHQILDCYTLVRDYYDLELNITIPDYQRNDDWWKKGEDTYRENYASAGFTLVDDKPKEHDVIIMCLGVRVPNHAGVFIGNNKMIHHVQKRLSCEEVYGGYWRKITWGVVRYKDFL